MIAFFRSQREVFFIKALQRRHALRLAHDGIIFELLAFTVFQLFISSAEL